MANKSMMKRSILIGFLSSPYSGIDTFLMFSAEKNALKLVIVRGLLFR